MGTSPGGKKILLLAGDYAEDYEMMVHAQLMQACLSMFKRIFVGT